MTERVIYRHTVEAFVERVVVRRGLLSLEFDRELRGLGVDVSRPRELRLEVWVALLRACAKRLSPGSSEADALEAVGREMLRGYVEGLVGKALFIVLRMLGPRRALLRMTENFRTADNTTEIAVRELSPSSIEVEFSTSLDVPTYLRGLLLEALVVLRVQQATVTYRDLPSGATVFLLSWG